MAEPDRQGQPRERGSRGEAPGCPVCGTVIPDPPIGTGSGVEGSPGATKCPGCGEEFPDRFLRDEFMHDAAGRFRLEGKGELGSFGEGGIPKPVDRPLGSGPMFETGKIDRQEFVKGELRTGDMTAFQVAPSTELAGKDKGLPGDEVLHSRKPGPGDESLMGARSPKQPSPPVGPPGVSAKGVGRDEETTHPTDRKTRPAPPR